jgi:putative glutamine amidotransferase
VSRHPRRQRLTPTGWSPDDKLIETVEDPTKRFCVGVQWHPEDTTDFRLFAALVSAASLYRADAALRR